MKKVWTYKRRGIKGWWVGWYESGKRKAKALPSKKLAAHYKQIKYSQLNSDVFTGIVAADWQQMVAEYRGAKKVQGVTEGTLYEIALSLRNFERLIGKCSSKQITQNVIDKFILQRGSEVKRPTLNKDIRNLKTFVMLTGCNIPYERFLWSYGIGLSIRCLKMINITQKNLQYLKLNVCLYFLGGVKVSNWHQPNCQFYRAGRFIDPNP